MVVNIIAHMVHSPPIHKNCFVNKDFIIIIIIINIVLQNDYLGCRVLNRPATKYIYLFIYKTSCTDQHQHNMQSKKRTIQ